MKQGKANASTVINTLPVISDAPAPEPFVVAVTPGCRPNRVIFLGGVVVVMFVAEQSPSIPGGKEREILLCHYILRNKKGRASIKRANSMHDYISVCFRRYKRFLK